MVDGNAVFWRSYHGVKAKLTGPDGEPTWAVHGTIMALSYAVRDLEPTHIVVAWDQGKSAYRNELFPAYKQAREKDDSPERRLAVKQIDRVRVILREMGMLQHSEQGVEGDDILATVALRWGDDMPIVMMSGDKDVLQLVSENVAALRPSHEHQGNDLWGPDEVYAKYGFPPAQIVDYLALMGDSVDGIPGVRGVGDVRAKQFIRRYGSASVAVMRDRKLQGSQHEAELSYKLVLLDGSVAQCSFTLEQAEWKPVVGSPTVEARLDELGLEQLKAKWLQGNLWEMPFWERGKKPVFKEEK